MTRDSGALHVGQTVITPNGIGVIRARRGGPITQWLALDYWWRESQITLPELPEPEPTGVCVACHRGLHCEGQGGVMVHGEARPCGCDCGRRRKRESYCIDCHNPCTAGATRCRTCSQARQRATRTAICTRCGAPTADGRRRLCRQCWKASVRKEVAA